jgi:hypothetical protein
MIGGIQKVPTSTAANNVMNKTGFEFTQKFEKSELSGLIGNSNKAPVRKGFTPKNENE